jgi:ketosteroid isomerase-like protein
VTRRLSLVLMVVLLALAGRGVAQVTAGNARPEQVAELKAVLDGVWAGLQAKDVPGVVRHLHEKSAFWLMDDPAKGAVVHGEDFARALTASPPPEGVALGEVKAWVSGDFALASAAISLPAELEEAGEMSLGAMLVRTDGQWQVVTADLFSPEPEAPADTGDADDDAADALMQKTLGDFRQELMAKGMPLVGGSLSPEGVVVGWDGQAQKLVVLRPRDVPGAPDAGSPAASGAKGRVKRPTTLQGPLFPGLGAVALALPSTDDGYEWTDGGGMVAMTAEVSGSVSGTKVSRRLVIYAGYAPQDGKWQVYAAALVPLPPK